MLAIGGPGGFAAEIDPMGAQLQALRGPAGTDLLWDGDPAFWTGRAPILFPIVGSLNDDRYRWQGRDWSLPRHGFARRMIWQTVAHGADHATLRLEAGAETRAVYPFEFVLEMEFAVRDAELAMTAKVRNAGCGVMPFSLGFHPALRWPFAPGSAREDYLLQFELPEPGPVCRLDGAGLIARREPSPLTGDVLVPSDRLFADDALVFRGLESRSVRFGVPGGEWLRCTFPGFPDLGLWSKPGAGYLCIEPWLGHADPAGFEGSLDEKPGITVLPPGGEWQGTMTIALE
jgi:galactose mutarotase-like enzyme